MNERIRELWAQCVIKHTKTPMNWQTVADEFAELIIQECAEIALEQKKWVEDQQVFNPRDKEWNLARIQQSQRIVDKIKEHFGVEE